VKKKDKELLKRITEQENERHHYRGLGHQSLGRQRGLRGSKFGPASPCRRIDPKTGKVIEVLR